MLGGRLAAEWLKAQGVTDVFALCGEHILPLLDGFAFLLFGDAAQVFLLFFLLFGDAA